ncbi:MAG: hypothetical protein V3T86_13750 [Planctomycetota bacterium]
MRRLRPLLLGLAIVLAVGLGLALAARGGPELEIEVVGLSAEDRVLDLGTRSPKVAIQHELNVRSFSGKRIRLEARLEDGHPEGMKIVLDGHTDLLPQGQGKLRLAIECPSTVGPYKTKAVIFSKDLPGWELVYEVKGINEPRKIRGASPEFNPRRVQLGNVRPGTQHDISFSIRNIGSDDLVISEWHLTEKKEIRLYKVGPGDLIVPGGVQQVNGKVMSPARPGPFTIPIKMDTNARLGPKKTFFIVGTVVPRYRAEPARVLQRRTVRARRPEFRIRLIADDGEPPFSVGSIENLGRYLEELSRGSDGPAASQTLKLRLASSAPIGPARFTIAVKLAPGGEIVHIPFEFEIVRSIVAHPTRINFGKTANGARPERELRLLRLVGGAFRVTSAVSRDGKFEVKVVQAGNMPPRILVRPAAGLPSGITSDQILVETDDPDTPKLIVDANVEVLK